MTTKVRRGQPVQCAFKKKCSGTGGFPARVDGRYLVSFDDISRAKMCVANGKVCGSPMFERQVRVALRKSPHNIKLITSSFHIDENTSSRTSSFRFRNVPRSKGQNSKSV